MKKLNLSVSCAKATTEESISAAGAKKHDAAKKKIHGKISRVMREVGKTHGRKVNGQFIITPAAKKFMKEILGISAAAKRTKTAGGVERLMVAFNAARDAWNEKMAKKAAA